MRKTIALILTMTVFASALSGCSAVITSSTRTQGAQTLPAPVNGAPNNTPPQGITVNDMDFEELDVSTLPEATQNFIKSNMKYRGYVCWQEEGTNYIAVFSGEKPNGGYDISIKSVEDNEGITNILVEETAPSGPATEVLTYPIVLIKLNGITNNINAVDTNGNTFELLNPGC